MKGVTSQRNIYSEYLFENIHCRPPLYKSTDACSTQFARLPGEVATSHQRILRSRWRKGDLAHRGRNALLCDVDQNGRRA